MCFTLLMHETLTVSSNGLTVQTIVSSRNYVQHNDQKICLKKHESNKE